MRIAFVASVMLFVSPLYAAEEPAVGGFIEGGLTSSSISFSDSTDPTFSLDSDGAGIYLTGGIAFKPGMRVQAEFRDETFDDGEACFGGCVVFNDEIDRSQFRLGVYWAPPYKRVVGWRVGGGYHQHNYSVSSFNVDFDGPFADAAVIIRAGQVADFEIGLTLVGLEGESSDGYGDGGGADFHVGVKFHAGPVDLGLRLRGSSYSVDLVGGGTEDQDLGALEFTVGGNWGFPN